MPVAEAGGAPEVIVEVDVEVSGFAPVAAKKYFCFREKYLFTSENILPLSLDVLLAGAGSVGGVAAGRVAEAALQHALARLTPRARLNRKYYFHTLC